MFVTPLGMVTPDRLVQLKNAWSPMVFSPLPIVTLASREQSVNALTPMLVTLLGMITFVTPPEKPKACVPMLVTGKPPTAEGIVTVPPGPVYPVIVIVPLFVL